MFLSPYAEANLTRMPALATELLRYEPAVFATGIADESYGHPKGASSHLPR